MRQTVLQHRVLERQSIWEVGTVGFVLASRRLCEVRVCTSIASLGMGNSSFGFWNFPNIFNLPLVESADTEIEPMSLCIVK
jgi:hypothetical protein